MKKLSAFSIFLAVACKATQFTGTAPVPRKAAQETPQTQTPTPVATSTPTVTATNTPIDAFTPDIVITPVPTVQVATPCTKTISTTIAANETFFNAWSHPTQCGQNFNTQIPAGSKNLIVKRSSISTRYGTCGSLGLEFYSVSGSSIASSYALQVSAKPLPISTDTLFLDSVGSAGVFRAVCNNFGLTSLGMGKNASGQDVAALEYTVTLDISYETPNGGSCR